MVTVDTTMMALPRRAAGALSSCKIVGTCRYVLLTRSNPPALPHARRCDGGEGAGRGAELCGDRRRLPGAHRGGAATAARWLRTDGRASPGGAGCRTYWRARAAAHVSSVAIGIPHVHAGALRALGIGPVMPSRHML